MQKISNWAWNLNKEYNEIMREPDPDKKLERLKAWRVKLSKGEKG